MFSKSEIQNLNKVLVTATPSKVFVDIQEELPSGENSSQMSSMVDKSNNSSKNSRV